MRKMGFLGLGVMGLPMAINLAKKNNETVMGYDVFEERRNIFKDKGGIPVDNVENIYKNCDIIFLSLPTNDIAKNSIQQIIELGRKGTIIVDLGSTAPNVMRELYEKAKAKGIKLLGSPVSGGEPGAINGKLVIMCGGDKDVFNEMEPILLKIGSNATYMGSIGCGNVAKLANNMMVAIHLGAVAEAYTFAVKGGLDPNLLFSAIKEGSAGSTVMNQKVPKIISRDFSASAKMALHLKDLMNAKQLASEMNVDIPLSKMIIDFMNEIKNEGKINEDHCAIVKVYEKKMGIEVK
jgi:2-hydroxy-3-oxopropionate reductase